MSAAAAQSTTARLVRSAPSTTAAFALEVRAGLGATPRTLPSKWLYDAVGSALFEAITELDAYGLTRAEQRLLDSHADAIAARAPTAPIVIELGAGSGKKTHSLLAALATHGPITYRPIDVSPAALVMCVRELEDLATGPGHAGVTIEPMLAEYLPGLATALAARGRRPALVLFLGSSIGNFDRDEAAAFLAAVRAALRPGDALLLATDLVKPVEQLIVAYDDPAGVTAAFDKNVLARVNRELGGDFDLAGFRHEARWNPDARRIEMHLVATRACTVRIRAAELTIRLADGESIWTESSHKFDAAEVIADGERAGFDAAGQWRDAAWPFAQTLFVAR